MRADTTKDVGQVGERIFVVGHAGGDEGIQAGEVLAGLLVSNKQEVLSAEGDDSHEGAGGRWHAVDPRLEAGPTVWHRGRRNERLLDDELGRHRDEATCQVSVGRSDAFEQRHQAFTLEALTSLGVMPLFFRASHCAARSGNSSASEQRGAGLRGWIGDSIERSSS